MQTFWCPICKANKEAESFITVGSRDGVSAFRVCCEHVAAGHLPENNPNHWDGTLRDVVFENGQLVELNPPPQNGKSAKKGKSGALPS